jgi:hypothetical protein
MFVGDVAPMNIRGYVHQFNVHDEYTEVQGIGPRLPHGPYICRLTDEYNLYIHQLTDEFSIFYYCLFWLPPQMGTSKTGTKIEFPIYPAQFNTIHRH